MQFRLITFTVAITVMAAMAACGPNKKRGTTINRTGDKASAESELNKVTQGADLTTLADGKATFKESCANPIAATEGETALSQEKATELLADGATYDLVSFQLHTEAANKAGKKGSASAKGVGPIEAQAKQVISDEAGDVTCHTSVTAEKDAPVIDGFFMAPSQLSLEASAVANINMQARDGKTAVQVVVAPLKKMTAEELNANLKGAVLDSQQRIIIRDEMKATEGTGVMHSEAVYAKRTK